MAFITILKAMIARALFATHAFIAVWKLVDLKNGQPVYWYMVSLIMFQGFEAIVSICARNGEEMKWFCPSVFLYLVSVVPPIWLMELGLHDLRVNSTQTGSLAELGGIKLDLALPIEQWVRVLEQVLLVMLLVGRWLLPKGELTREQLSQLLLAYMAMAADIIELFECFKEDIVTKNINLIYAVLGIWSWSLLQFTLVLSATHAPKPRPSINYPPPEIIKIELPKPRRDSDLSKPSCVYNIDLYLNMDIIAILTTVILQDGPFLMLRMTLIFHYKVVSYLNIFFTCKNTLVVSLQLYRLFVLCSKRGLLWSNKERKILTCFRPLPSSKASSSAHESLKSDLDNILPSPVEVAQEEEEEEGEEEEEEDQEEEEEKAEDSKTQVDDKTAEETLEESLIELIDQIGEEKILREIESMMKSANEEVLVSKTESCDSAQEPILPPPPTHYGHATSLIPHTDLNYEEEDYSPPDSGYQNYSSADFIGRKSLKRQQSVSKRTRDYVKQTKNYMMSGNHSDCASLSDMDEMTPRMHYDLNGVSGSSTSLVDVQTDGRQRGWNIIKERYLPNTLEEWRGSSEPKSLHREGRSKVMHLRQNNDLGPQKYYTPVLQRKIRPDKRGTSMRIRGPTANLVPQAVANSVAHDRLRKAHSFNMNSHMQNSITCISESDGDTMESAV